MISLVLGTRPEIVKLSPVIHELKHREISFRVIHTNQHYSASMDQQFFKDLELPEPDINLHVSNISHHGEMVGQMITKIEEDLLLTRPTVLIVQGDTNSVLAGGLAASKLGIAVAHVEAGLRSYDRTMPEEINRVVVDHLASFLFCPTKVQKDILQKEGVSSSNCFVVGNTAVDAVQQNRERAIAKFSHKNEQPYVLLTLHRPANVDDPQHFSHLLDVVSRSCKQQSLRVVFPVHPRTQSIIDVNKIALPENIQIIPPVGYLAMLALQSTAQVIVTDSGGIQEEACVLQVPCITLRTSTERPETVAVGANVLVGEDLSQFTHELKRAVTKERSWENPFGDGTTSAAIVDVLQKHDREMQ